MVIDDANNFDYIPFSKLVILTWHSNTPVNTDYLIQLSLVENFTALFITITKVINVGSDTFGNPIFQKGLQN